MHAGLKVGDSVERVMVVAKKVRRDFKGGKFLLFQFSDKDGTLKGVLWEPSDRIENEVRVNDVVRVKGDIQEYQGSLQLKVGWMEKLEESDYDPAIFLPASSRDTSGMYDEILKIISSISNEDLRALLQTIFEEDGFRASFLKSPAAKGWHHSYVGGLAEHVHDMVRTALRAAEVYHEVDRDLLVAGVLLHDLGKLQELTVTNHISYSDRGRLMGHITLGVELLEEYLRGMEDFPREIELKIKHMILSHHGSLDNGSPVVPMTVEALLLHYIDNMDAQVRGTLQALDRTGGGEGNWTEYIKLLDRFIYRGGESTGPPNNRGGGKSDE